MFNLGLFTKVVVAEISSSVQGKGGGPPHQAKYTSWFNFHSFHRLVFVSNVFICVMIAE